MNKKIIIIIICFGWLFVISIAIGAYFYIQEQNKKLSLSYNIRQCGEEEPYNEYDEGTTKSYNGIKYDCYNRNYNQIVKFKEDAKSSQETYVFRVETPVKDGNGGENFNYEIARIVIDTVNPKETKCTYNYRGNAGWKHCNERDLIKSLPDISIAKKKAYKVLEPYIKEENEIDANSYYVSSEYVQYNEAKLKETYEKYQKYLGILKNTTIEK